MIAVDDIPLPVAPVLPLDPLVPLRTINVDVLPALSVNVYTFSPPSAVDVAVCLPPVRTTGKSVISDFVCLWDSAANLPIAHLTN